MDSRVGLPDIAASDSGTNDFNTAIEGGRTRDIPPLEVSWLSRLTLAWAYPLIRKASKEVITADDAPGLPLEMHSATAVNTLEEEYLNAVAEGSSQPTFRTIWRVFKSTLIRGMLWSVMVGLCASVARPILLKYLIQAAEDDDNETAFIFIGSLAGTLLLEGLALTCVKHELNDRFGAMWIMTLSNLVQRKSLLIAPGVAGSMSEQSLVGSDVLQRYELLKLFSQFPSSIVSLVGGVAVLVYTIGLAGLVGLGLMTIVVLINIRVAFATTAAEGMSLKASDKRLAIMTRVIEGMKAIKFSAWEEIFEEEVRAARIEEGIHIKHHRSLQFISVQLGRATPVLAAALSFIVMSLMGEELESSDIFAALNVFQSLRIALILLPVMFSIAGSFVASVKRVESFLNLPELQKVFPPEDDSPDSVAITSSSFAYAGSDETALEDITFKAPKGKLVAVVGAVGAGKSTLLTSILGGVPQVECNGQMPTAFVEPDIGYVPQRAFIAAGTMLDNILMGRPLDEERLRWVLTASCLDADLKRLPGGLSTELGERGVTLSGGQQQRVSIARALYSRPKLLVMDDPLAAVDAQVGASIFEKAVLGSRRITEGDEPQTIVMVLNQLQFLPHFDYIYHLESGRVKEEGTPDVLLHNESGLAKIMEEVVGASDDVESNENPAPQQQAKEVEEEVHEDDQNEAGGGLVKRETRVTGAVSWNVAISWIKGMGCVLGTLAVVLGVLAYAALAFSDRWLAHWVEESEDAKEKNEDIDDTFYSLVYGGGCLAFVIFLLLDGLAWAAACVRSGRALHEDCVHRVLRAPISWYEENPSGRLLSRFSTDLSIVDSMLTMLTESFFNFTMILIMLVVVVIVILPWMAFVLAVGCLFYGYCIVLVDRANREVKRLANNTNSLVQTTLSEIASGQGKVLVRSMGFSNLYCTVFQGHLDELNRLNFVSAVLVNWGTFWAYLTAFFISTTAAVIMVTVSDLPTSSMGLALTYCFMFPYFLQVFCVIVMVIKSSLTSLERLLETRSDAIPQEPAWHQPGDDALLQSGWPRTGKVEFVKTELVYRPNLPPALREVTLSFEDNERVGIVGRTGAGKSSLLVLLFRLVEASKGKVLLDGVDVSTVGLQTLRQNMTIIPQEPLLMSGTVRYNLDPAGKKNDKTLRDILQTVGLRPELLNKELGTGGSSISAGERQLLSLARALLRDSRVVVMDEPTSNVDPTSDAQIQRVVRSELTNSTVVTIAHRLGTVIDADRIVVMDSGAVVQHGHAADLMKNKEGRLWEMISGLGATAVAHLAHLAEESRAKMIKMPPTLSVTEAPVTTPSAAFKEADDVVIEIDGEGGPPNAPF